MPDRPMSLRVTVSVVYVVAMFMAIMDTRIVNVNVALPTMSRDLSMPLNRVDGVVVGFLVALAVFIPASGWLGDRFGTRRVFLAALAIFTLASAARPSSWNDRAAAATMRRPEPSPRHDAAAAHAASAGCHHPAITARDISSLDDAAVSPGQRE